MKKKYLLTFIIFAASFFCFIDNGKAATSCTYKIDNIANSTGTGNSYEYFYGYTLNRLDSNKYQSKQIVDNSNYNKMLIDFLNTYIGKFYVFVTELTVPRQFEGTYTEKITDDTISGNIKFYRVTDATDSKGNGYKPIELRHSTSYFNYSEKYIKIDGSYDCADMLLLKIDVSVLGDGGNWYNSLKGSYRIYYDEKNKKFNGKIPDDLFDDNTKNIYLLAINENSSIYSYYRLKQYDLNMRQDNFELYDKYNIEKIFKLYKSYQFDYAKIYDLLNKNGGKVDENIIKELSGEIAKIPYFNNATGRPLTANEIAKYIWNDVEVLQDYQLNVINKMIDEKTVLWNVEGRHDAQDIFALLEKYENENYARYVKTTYELLYALIKDDTSIIESIKNAQLDNDIKKISDDKCSDSKLSDEQQKQCKNEQCEFLNFDCGKFKNMVPGSLQNETEHLIYYNSYHNCNSSNTTDCIVEQCELLRNEAQETCPKAVNGESENQKDLEKVVDKVAQQVIPKLGYDIKTNDLCTFLFETDNPDVKPLYYYIVIVFNWIRIGGPILIIILTALDGMKVISSFKEEESKKFLERLKVRLICLVILILVPSILKFVIDLFEQKICDINDLKQAYDNMVKTKTF